MQRALVGLDLPSVMALNEAYAAIEPTNAEVDAIIGPCVLEFSASWDGVCKGAQPLLASAFRTYPRIRHVKISDGKGRPLGRSFRVHAWPTLVFLKDGVEVSRLECPRTADEIVDSLERIAA